MTAALYAVLGALVELLPFAALVVIVCVLPFAVQRNWPRVPSRWRVRKVPGRNPDGRQLTVPEQERMDVIEDGYGKTAQEPGWKR
jgi:hypothetical protein